MSTEKQNFQFPIPNDVLEPYIKQAVSASIIGALGDGTKLIEMAVQSAMNQKVSSNGTVSRYQSDNRYILAEIIGRNKIQEIAKEVLVQMAEKMRPEIEKEVTRQVAASKSTIAKVLVEGLMGSIRTSFHIEVEVNGNN